jgi:cation-transporting ATPase 13A2
MKPVYGLVTSTGFLTTKGSLVRDILYPKQFKFKFYEDGMKFVAIMALIAVVGFIAIFPILLLQNASVSTLIDRSLNLIVIAVPPALPAAMSCGMIFAIRRLKSQKIFCISPPRVNMAGRVTTFVFDKTGTLTEDGLSVQGFRPSNEQTDDHQSKDYQNFSSDCNDLISTPKWWLMQDWEKHRNMTKNLLLESMASCTAITYVNGVLIGDPLDVKMF